MKEFAIRVQNLGKRYRIGERTPYRSLRESIARSVSSPFSKASNGSGVETDSIWALKEVSFEIRQGEVVGIVGPNGAGKSTLLKILARITKPTEGHVEIEGNVGTLLEVGTGFHNELTGRENVFLNGAILGMRRTDVQRRFDEIVSFAGVEQFIDTPVKHFSSGMYMRLAFAVAAHLDPTILLVDEVLAVGDIAFQQKCIGKMEDISRQGRTVLFVSHNLQAIASLCSTSLLLHRGRLLAQGETPEITRQYMTTAGTKFAEAVWPSGEEPATEYARLCRVQALNSGKTVSFDFLTDEEITLRIEFSLLKKTRIEVSFHLFNQLGVLLFASGNFQDSDWMTTEHEPGVYSCSCTIPKRLLNDGVHHVKVILKRGFESKIELPSVISFAVHDHGDEARGGWTGQWIGSVRPILPWTGERIGEL